MSGIGHNSLDRDAQDHMRKAVQRIENLEVQKKALSDDIKEIKAELKAKGHNMKAFNAFLRRRKHDKDENTEVDDWVSIYEDVMG